MPSVDDKGHAALERDVRKYLTDAGFWTLENTYHAIAPKEVVDALRSQYGPTSMAIRSKADRIAGRFDRDATFYWECKTTPVHKWRYAAVELFPLLIHVNNARLGTECLYAYRRCDTGFNAGFWTHELPPISDIRFPGNDRWGTEIRDFMIRMCADLFPGAPVRHVNPSPYGSNDPFIRIDVDGLEHWERLIDTKVHTAAAGVSEPVSPYQKSGWFPTISAGNVSPVTTRDQDN